MLILIAGLERLTFWSVCADVPALPLPSVLSSGLLHISKITATRITSVGDVLSVDEKVKVLVVKSIIPDKISLR